MSPTAPTCPVGLTERNVEQKGKKRRKNERMEVIQIGKNGKEKGMQ
jgi:hypothetical protein